MPDDILAKRRKLIDEAIGWDGTIAQPRQHLVSCLSDGSRLVFDKPGKEVLEGTNVNDMRPMIIIKGVPLDPPSFSFIWSDLTNIAMADFEAFRAVLVLIYRSAFLLDHTSNGEHNWRYEPASAIKQCIAELDKAVGNRTEFGSVDGLLRFIDILGWNEDVKYHSFNGRASFEEGRYGGRDHMKIGRVNTLLTCIRVSYDVSKFMEDHRREIEHGERANFVQLYDIMQTLINSKGLCLPRKMDLIEHLCPYLLDGSSKGLPSGCVGIGSQRSIV